jgi:hypothetical protein
VVKKVRDTPTNGDLDLAFIASDGKVGRCGIPFRTLPLRCAAGFAARNNKWVLKTWLDSESGNGGLGLLA